MMVSYNHLRDFFSVATRKFKITREANTIFLLDAVVLEE